MSGVDVDLFEMCLVRSENLDMREANGSVAIQRYPQSTFTLRIAELSITRGLTENRVGRVAIEKGGSRELDLVQQWKILRARAENVIVRLHKDLCV
jgi:hypothetical protein